MKTVPEITGQQQDAGQGEGGGTAEDSGGESLGSGGRGGQS